MNPTGQEVDNMSDTTQNTDWRVLAKQAAEQDDAAKLMETIEALTNALDREQIERTSYAR